MEETNLKVEETSLTSRWYIRYLIALAYCSVGTLGLVAWGQGNLQYTSGAIFLLFNPVTACICMIAATLYAWELSLILVFLLICYFLYLGAALLPTSVAVIIGAIIIAYAFNKRRT